jgi:hypothetical protein
MGSSQQALLMVGEDGFVPPPIPTCVPDPYYSCGPDGDPYWANVVLMLHGEGADGSSALVDSSQIGHTSTVYLGAPTITTTEKRFGEASLWLDDNFEGWTIATSALTLNAGESCTIEFWFRPTTSGSNRAILTSNWSAGNTQTLSIGWNGISINARIASNTTVLTGALSLGVWYHIAVVRAESALSIYVNGTLANTTTIASNASIISSFAIGVADGNFGWSSGAMECYLDDLRITKGIARYTGPFNIPAEAFPDFEGDAGYFDLPRTVLSIHAEINPVSSTLDSFNPSPVNTRTGVTFSNGNKTVAYVSASAINYAAIATRARRSGKYYWEVRLINQGNGTLMGFVRASIARTPGWIQQLQSTPAADPGNGAFRIDAGGGTAYQAASGPTVAGAGVNKTYMFAVDFDNAKIWIGIDGVWHNSGNPAAGTNQTLSMTSFVAGFPCVNSNGSFGGGSEFTIRLSDVDVEYSIPTGFSAWATTEDSLNDEYPTDDSSCYQTKLLEFSGQNSAISSAQVKFGSGSLFVPNSGVSTADGTFLLDHQDFDFGTGDFTIECWAYRLANTYEGYLYYATMGGEFSFRVLRRDCHY